MKNNRKSYPEVLTKARAALEQKLSALYGRTIKVWIFADLFDVEDEEWKNAVEGRLGRLKLSLITEPKVAADAAKAFREMGQFEEIDLIHSEAVTKSNPRAEEGSLYEAVRAVEPFADSCLKRYLGRIMKCRTVEELRSAKDGVTPDCYSYSNFIFRHLKKRDYTVGACIGSKVSRARQQDYEVDAQRLKKELEEAEAAADDYEKHTLLRDKVTDEEIAKIVGRWTGIPVSKLMEGEREKLLHLDEVLHKRVIGQDEAVQKVSEAILRSRAGIQDPNRPIGSFLFMGPTGVGKTELAKALAQALFDDEKNIVRIDMTEYMEKHSVSRLIGAPPGYVGYEEGGQLTEAVRRKPYSVVLFDEVEKAHPDVFNILLQVLDDGRITDSQGRTVDFKNTIIILTSNLGSEYILEGIDENNEITPEARAQVDKLLKTHFRPEFLNRLDEIVFYKPLSKKEIYPIIDLMLDGLRKRLEDKQLELEVTDEAKEFIAKEGYDPIYGARPLKRYIQSKLETLIARTMIANDLDPFTTIKVDSDGEKLSLTTIAPEKDS